MTQRTIVSLLTVLLLSSLAPVQAATQEGDAAPRPSELGINFERVKRKLAALPAPDEERSLLKLSYVLDVYGLAPDILVFEGFDTLVGAVPFGPPTHAALRELWTPEEFSTPAADLGSLFNWLRKR